MGAREPYVTVTSGMRGYFAVLMCWVCEQGEGYWEPFNTGIGSYGSIEDAAAEGRRWAEAEGIEFKA